ncbi:MAG: succinate dehydrogenase/fumarate reductase iron-sulfur subunit [Alphaproteobacteria bacterium]|nr:succinate dehydrogenase/fumarate reductase iron-sulfur subunit [Alphaproteobacteria bacterium]
MKVNLRIWRQKGPDAPGAFQDFSGVEVVPEMSFLEMLDEVNRDLEAKGQEPVVFDSDCREGICGSCGAVVDGTAHGPGRQQTLCQLHMRSFQDGDTITVEPWRAAAFPVVRDLMVDRSAFDRIIQAGGYVTARTGSAPDANAVPIGKPEADAAFDAATCIGCGACVAACPNASAMLFVSAKSGHLGLLPQGQPQRYSRAEAMVQTMDGEGFGGCSNHGECEAACPKGIGVSYIARLNRDLLRAASGAASK